MAKKPKLDAFSAHEALDRSYLAATLFNDHVAEHPYVLADKQLKRQAEALSERLFDFYQTVGRKTVKGVVKLIE